MPSSKLIATIAAFLVAMLIPAHAKEPQKGLPSITLSAGGQPIRADVAATDATREKGLMFREKMGKNEGMLFVFSSVGYHAMWMRNTPLPLSVAFMDEAGKILSIHEMEPQSESTHQSAGPARFALEMNKGWFATHKVKVGDAIKGLDKAPKPQ
jgi:uncharacterized membrane protein (UPF0127 family)